MLDIIARLLIAGGVLVATPHLPVHAHAAATVAPLAAMVAA